MTQKKLHANNKHTFKVYTNEVTIEQVCKMYMFHFFLCHPVNWAQQVVNWHVKLARNDAASRDPSATSEPVVAVCSCRVKMVE